MSKYTHAFADPDGLNLIDVVHPATGLSLTNGHTLEQIQAEYPGAKLVEIDPWIKQKEEMLCSDLPSDITEDQFMEMLEVLPPQRWVQRNGNESFEMSEHLSGRVTSTYVRLGDRYFTFTAIAGTPHEALLERVKAECVRRFLAIPVSLPL